MSRHRILLVTASIVSLLLIALAVGIVVYVTSSNADKVHKFEATSKANWQKISDQSKQVSAALARVGSVVDLAAVSGAAHAMVPALDAASLSISKDRVPSGYGNISTKQKAAIEALKTYLVKVDQLAARGDQQAFNTDLGILEDRARAATAAVNDFMEAAPFVKVKVPVDFYQAALSIPNAWRPPPYANVAESQAVYDAAAGFINADIRGPDLDAIWSMLSTKLHKALDIVHITRDTLASRWAQQWGDVRPVDFYINRRDINFTDANTATVKVVMYVNHGGPRIETMRLVKENGVWRIETYPYAGWS